MDHPQSALAVHATTREVQGCARLMRQSLHRLTDSWASRLPYNVRALAFEWLTSRELAQCAAVCTSWEKLPRATEDRLFRSLYLREFEAETCDDMRIADEGAATAWRRRFVRRVGVERCWTCGEPQLRTVADFQHTGPFFG